MNPENEAQNVNHQQAVAVNQQGATAAVSVELPEFWKTDPEMWFAQAEAQFILGNITKDDTKFYHIVAKLDQSVICHVADLVSNPPQADKYKILRIAWFPALRFHRKYAWNVSLDHRISATCGRLTCLLKCKNWQQV